MSTYEPAIAINRGGTRAHRTPDEAAAWATRIRAIAARAAASLRSHGATAEDVARSDETLCLPETDTLYAAARAFEATLTAEQRAAIAPAGGNVLNLYEGLYIFPLGHAAILDQYVPCAEALWPPVTPTHAGDLCPKCAAPVVAVPGTGYYRGRYLAMLVCKPCGVTWDNADDSLLEVAKAEREKR